MILKHYYYYYTSAIPIHICDKIIKEGKEMKKERALIGDPKKNIMNHTRAEIEKLASQAKGSNPITIGTPAQYRKWFTKRKGKIVK